MPSIDEILDIEIRIEGGYVDNPSDRGGPTNYGITLRTLEAYFNRPVTVDELKALTPEKAEEIFKSVYYIKPGIDQLPDALQPQVLDISINSGPQTAVRLLQEALNTCGFSCTVDGVLGPATIGLTRLASNQTLVVLVNALEARRERFYRAIANRDPTQRQFLDGWLKRARTFIVPHSFAEQ